MPTNVHYKPLPLLTAYRNLGFDIADFPNALAQFANEITLPLHTKLTDDDTDEVCRSLHQAISQAKAEGQALMYVRFGKRIWDILIGLIALPFVLLIIAALAPLIKLEDGGPVFYNAPRVGKDGVDFKMYKLRSMRVNAPDLIMEDGSTYNGADDPRMTKIGAFMRQDQPG